MAFKKEDKRRWFILQCRYYKGESEPPHTLPEGYSLMWDYEMRWVQWNLDNDDMLKHFDADIKALNLETKPGDQTPLTLKALLCNRYLHWGGYAPLEEELKGFEKWYVNYYQLWKTNREHRADKRRPALTSKCRYYHGEDCCPYTESFNIQIWKWEKEWVEALANSHSNRELFFKELMNAPCLNTRPLSYWKNYAHKVWMPATLLAYFGMNFAKNYGGFKHEIEENFDYFIVKYATK